MESYRQFTRDLGIWYGMLCRNKKTGKIHIYALRRDSGNPEELLDKNYESIETRLLTNPRALLLANYHKKLPIKDTKYKFDIIPNLEIRVYNFQTNINAATFIIFTWANT